MGFEKVFFSYSRVDGEQAALKLASDLRKLSANVWIDQLDIRAGTLWDEEIERALESSDCILFIATPKSTTSNNVLNEVYFAIEENKHVIPLIFGDCKIPFRLKRLQHIDFTGDYNHAFERLLEALDLKPGASGAQKLDNQQEEHAADTSHEVPDEHNHGKQLKEQLLWSKAVNANTIDVYDEYLLTFPNGKFRNLAIQKKSELIDLEDQAVENARGGPKIRGEEKPRVQNKGSNRKSITIAAICIAGILIIGVAIYLVINRSGTTTDFASQNTILPDTSAAVDNSSKIEDHQQSSSNEAGNALLSDQLSKGSATPRENDPSGLKAQSDQKFSNPSTTDFDALIYEKMPGSWYETIQRDNGLTSLSAQTYYSNGNLEGVSTFKNANGVVVGSLTYLGIWSVRDGYLYEEVTSSSDHSVLAVGYNQRTRITNITNEIVDYIDTEGIARRMFRLKL